MKQPFTPEQSAEIDRRLVEMFTAVMGKGQCSRRCEEIAYLRSVKTRAAPSMVGRGAALLKWIARR